MLTLSSYTMFRVKKNEPFNTNKNMECFSILIEQLGKYAVMLNVSYLIIIYNSEPNSYVNIYFKKRLFIRNFVYMII
jgi:hypothetical protein